MLCDGKPLAGADVKFFPKNESKNLFCFARTNKKGEYKLQQLLGKADAAIPAGEYVVTVERVELVETGRTIVDADGVEAPETEERSLISERYRDPKTSGLSATVAPEGGVFNFELSAE